MKKRARREARHARHVNHTISKQVVAVAARTGRGIALEELSGIRGRVTVPRDQRARLSSWPFHQLGALIEYKARRAGVPCIEVDPAYTSQRCPRCGHTARNNRPSRGWSGAVSGKPRALDARRRRGVACPAAGGFTRFRCGATSPGTLRRRSPGRR
ncbi:IS200/IS605 family accessory protein TnpB-related protein [Actinomadura sp. BRA 177]|uniref:IS200/IS605 family accessory protein TnpB-related protein n=1 Tax=Actinomadura sp. BRA 177 TaxID=2745202 RepID=UPI0020CC972D|nr:IS200/IS605 family accessory protein TnpB-related protein [Actinomadura sp. BRA 177]